MNTRMSYSQPILVTIMGYEYYILGKFKIDKINFCICMQIPMNVILGGMGVTTNAITRWEASTVRATPPLTWIQMEGPASLVCSVFHLSSPYIS